MLSLFFCDCKSDPHQCTLPTRVENFTAAIEQAGSKVVDQVLSSLLKIKLEIDENSTSVLSLTQPRGGKALKVIVGAKRNDSPLKQQLLSADDLLKKQISTHISQRKVL